MKTSKLNILATLLTMVALAFGQTAQATITQSMAFEGFFNSNTSMHYWRIHGFWGTAAGPTTGSSGTSQTFNNNTFTFNGGHRITINGKLNFAVANNFTDVTTGSQVTLVFESSNYWFYGATVKTLSDANVTGCSYTISSDRHSITVTIPSGKTFGNVYLDFVPNAPMTNDNTTVTVPAGDYWVSNSSHRPMPEPTVVYGQTTLVKDTDYTLSWSNNGSAGTGTVTVTGKGNYTGSVSANFNIRWARYYVRFNKNHDDATGTMNDQQFTYNTAQNLTANAFSLSSYPFAGWSTTQNGAVTYTDGQSVSNLTAVDGETVTLYAQWTPPYTFNSTTGALTLNWGEFNKDNKWGDDVDPSKVTSVTATDEVSFTGDCYNLFYNFSHCTSMDLSKVNTGGLTKISCMFWGCQSLTKLDLSNWNTAAVTEMTSAFRHCTGLTSLNLTGWNTASVTTMYYLFYECNNLTTIEGISEWATGSVTDMENMFYQCSSLQSLDLSGWNTAKVTSMTEMFFGCSSLQSLDLSGWNTAKVTSMNSMFKSCSSLQSLDLSGWNTAKVTNMAVMFIFCSNLTTIYVGEGWNTSNVDSSDNMFYGCTSLVGGMGTGYDASHTDKEYARIDRGPSSDQPGYFTGSGPVESIIVDPNNIEMNVGTTYTILFTVLPTYATNKDVTFTSSDETVATVDADGDVTGVAAGTATITIASVSNPEVTTNVSVTVAEIPGDPYLLFTGDDLVEGDYLIVCDGKAMKNTISNNGFQCEEVVDINDMITTENADIVWHIAPSGYSWTIYNAQVAKYAGWSGSSNHVSLLDEINDKAFWSFEDGSDYYIIANYSSGLNYFLCGYGYPDVISFKCAQSTSSPLDERLSLYKKAEAPVTKTYTFDSTTGKLTLISGEFNKDNKWGNDVDPSAVTSVTATNQVSFTGDCADLFSGFENCTSMDLNSVNTASVTNMAGMFLDCSSLQSLDLSGWNTAGVLDMTSMFKNCSSLVTIYVGTAWSTENVTLSSELFYNCISIVGGNGFHHISTYSLWWDPGVTYAHIDMPDNPGYLTGRFNKDIAGYQDDESGWYLIASPISTPITLTEGEGILTNDYDLYRFNQSAESEWENWKQTGDHYHFNLESGRGYLYANSEDVKLRFTGVPYSGDGTVTLTKTANAEFEGWNLVGNPFTGTAYIDRDFYVMNDDGSEIVLAERADNHVDAMEGIFVHADEEGETLTFTTDAPSKGSGQKSEQEQLVINLSKGNRGSVIDRAIVRFDSESTLPKLQIFENSDKLFIPQDGKDYAIASVGRDAMHCVPTEIPVCFKAKNNGEYTLTVSESLNSKFQILNLIDNLTGANIDLLTTPSYTFTARSDDYPSRFKLVFSAQQGGEEADDDFAFISNGNIIVNGTGTLQVIDMLGHVLVSHEVNSSLLTPHSSLSPGVYVLRLVNGENVKTQKIVIKKN